MPVIYLVHPKHGTHIVYDESDVIRHAQWGWTRREEKKPEPQPEAPKRRPGRPRKSDPR